LGVALTVLPDALADVRTVVRRLQNELFVAQAQLARPPTAGPPTTGIDHARVERLERDIDRFEALHPPVHSFVLPGGSPAAAALHLARTVARRAERELVTLHQVEPVDAELLAWANRVGDLLFALALASNHALGVVEVPPDYSA
jgi:cob(I)alamin adenosyltransferase